MLGTLISEVLVLKPKNVIEFAVDFFGQKNLEEIVTNPQAHDKSLKKKLRNAGREPAPYSRLIAGI